MLRRKDGHDRCDLGQDQPEGDLLRRRHRRQRRPVALKANTALGLLARDAESNPALNPLLISDSFDFGLALCGVGKSVAKGATSWYLKVNHKGAMVSADTAKIKAGDEVLFALAESDPKTFAYPDELVARRAAEGDRGQSVHGDRLHL